MFFLSRLNLQVTLPAQFITKRPSNMHTNTLLATALTFLTVSAQAYAERYIDLSHTFDEQTIYWPTSAPFVVTKTETHDKDYYSTREYASGEHVGTHVDAPVHFARGQKGISDIPLTQLIGPAVKIDVSQAVKGKPDYLISIEDFKKWEAQHGRIAPDTIVLLSTGYGKFWPDFHKYAGSTKPQTDKQPDMHFPGLAPTAASWLVDERKVKALGIDTMSMDRGQSKDTESHKILSANNVPFFENVTDMSELPANNFKIYALPMKIKNGTGAPVRIIAEIK